MLDFVPDFPQTTPGGLDTIVDFVPDVNGFYRTAPAPYVEGYATVNAEVIGAALVKNSAGTQKIFGGTATRLYKADGVNNWTDLSAHTYAAASWMFAQLADFTIAADGVGTLQSATAGAFSDITGSPTGAKVVITHANAILAFNSTSAPDGWYRSDTGAPGTWTATAANDADSGNLYGGIGGPITSAATWQEVAVAFKSRGMYAGVFTGDIDNKIRWRVVDPDAGCIGLHAQISIEPGLVFVSDRDIYIWDGGKPHSIADKVRRDWVRAIGGGTPANIFLTHDEAERNVYFWYPTATYPARAYVWNYRSGKWGRLEGGLNNSTSTFTYVRCPVRGANYADYRGVGGMASNANFQANVVFSQGGRLLNYGNVLGQGSAITPSMGSWLVGAPDAEHMLSRLKIVYGANTAAQPSTSSVNVYNYSRGLVTSISGSPKSDGNVDYKGTAGAYFGFDVTWSAGVNISVEEFIPVFQNRTGIKLVANR